MPPASVEIRIFYQLTAEDLARYKELTDKCANLWFPAKPSTYDKNCWTFPVWSLDHYHLIICYELASHERLLIGEITPPATASFLQDSQKNTTMLMVRITLMEVRWQIGSDDGGHGEEPGLGRQFQCWRATFRSVERRFNDLGFAEDDAPDRKNFLQAGASAAPCFSSFLTCPPNIPKPTWRFTSFCSQRSKLPSSPMQVAPKADDFFKPLVSFDEQEIDWFEAQGRWAGSACHFANLDFPNQDDYGEGGGEVAVAASKAAAAPAAAAAKLAAAAWGTLPCARWRCARTQTFTAGPGRPLMALTM